MSTLAGRSKASKPKTSTGPAAARPKLAAARSTLDALTPVEHVPLHERVYRQLRRTLILGQLQPGQKLSVRGVAAMLQVSPMPVRAALTRLHAERGLALGRHGTVSVPRLDRETLAELMDMRVLLEGLAAERAAERMSRAELRQFEPLAKRLLGTSVVAYLEANAEFKLFVYTCAQSPVLLATIESMWLQLGPTMRCYGIESHFQGQRDLVLAATSALCDREPALARAAIEQDIRDGAAYLRAVMDRG